MQTPPTHPSSICTYTHLSIQPYVHNMNASIPYSNHHTFIHPFTPTSIYDSIHLPICLPTPSIHISIHVFVSTYTYIYTCTHPSIHHPSFYLPIHLSPIHMCTHSCIVYARYLPFSLSLCWLSEMSWNEPSSPSPKNLGILCNRPSAGTDLASENFDSMWTILWLHSLLFPLLHEYRKCPSMELMRKKRLLNALVSLADSPVSAQRPTLRFYIPSFSSEDKTHSWSIQ